MTLTDGHDTEQWSWCVPSLADGGRIVVAEQGERWAFQCDVDRARFARPAGRALPSELKWGPIGGALFASDQRLVLVAPATGANRASWTGTSLIAPALLNRLERFRQRRSEAGMLLAGQVRWGWIANLRYLDDRGMLLVTLPTASDAAALELGVGQFEAQRIIGIARDAFVAAGRQLRQDDRHEVGADGFAPLGAGPDGQLSLPVGEQVLANMTRLVTNGLPSLDTTVAHPVAMVLSVARDAAGSAGGFKLRGGLSAARLHVTAQTERGVQVSVAAYDGSRLIDGLVATLPLQSGRTSVWAGVRNATTAQNFAGAFGVPIPAGREYVAGLPTWEKFLGRLVVGIDAPGASP